MAKREIRNPLDRKNRNNHNSNYSELYKLKKTLNGLVLDSGESDTEVVQARAGEETLNDRLDNMEDSTNNVSGDVSTLESKVKDKMNTMASLSDLDSYSQEVSDELEGKLKEVNDTIDDAVGNIEFKGAMVSKNSDQKITGDWTTVEWDTTNYNLSGFWSKSNKTRLVIPEGVKKVRLSYSVIWESSNDGSRRVRISKNGQILKGGSYVSYIPAGTAPISASSGVIEVQEGDYFELNARQTSGEDLNLRSDEYTWFSIEVLDYGKK